MSTIRPITQRLREGKAGWVYVTVGIAVWDTLAEEDEQLTGAFRRSLKSPSGAIFTCATWGILTAHLFGLLPEEIDPIHMVTHVTRRGRRQREQARNQPAGIS
jgi:hypothetical protein